MVRTLLGIGIVVAIVAAFGVSTVVLPRWQTGYEKEPLVRGVVATTPAQRAKGPVTIYVALYAGRPRRLGPIDTPLDEASPEPNFAADPDAGPRSFRFELDAGSEDGPAFFVRAMVETTSFDQFCEDVRLPPARVVDEDWVDARTGRALAPVRLVPTDPCETP